MPSLLELPKTHWTASENESLLKIYWKEIHLFRGDNGQLKCVLARCMKNWTSDDNPCEDGNSSCSNTLISSYCGAPIKRWWPGYILWQ